MLETVAPCAIKGATFDCLRDAIERREIDREEEAKEGSRCREENRPQAQSVHSA